jgi:hypothetical protein
MAKSVAKVKRTTVDLSAYPDLVVIYLGMRVNSLRGLKTLLRLGPEIKAAVAAKPDGLLLHEDLMFSLWPIHAGMRQYWRDFESLETWARSTMPHQNWWKDFLRDSGGTGFWHETYFHRGGIEAIYDDIPKPIGMMQFAPNKPARGPMFSARQRMQKAGDSGVPPPVGEAEVS